MILLRKALWSPQTGSNRPRSQAFWQGTGGAAGSTEAGGLMGSAFVGGDLSTGSSTLGVAIPGGRDNRGGASGNR